MHATRLRGGSWPGRWPREMAECARQSVLEQYIKLLNDVRLSPHYVWSLKSSTTFSAPINQLPSCLVLIIVHFFNTFDIIDICVLCV